MSGSDQQAFPDGFFARADETDDAVFYAPDRFVTHIDDGAIAEVGRLYDELAIDGHVVDLCSSWISHFRRAPDELVAVGMNERELRANEMAASWLVHDLNADPILPFEDDHFDDAVCCASVDYLTRPVEVFREMARVVRPGGSFACTFSNRCFPTKAIRGWLATDDATHLQIVSMYFSLAGGFGPVHADRRTPVDHAGDPLFAVWARVGPDPRDTSS